MVQEVEFSNNLELLNPAYGYSDNPNQLMFDGVLSNAKTLQITVGNALPTDAEGKRKLLLYYGNVSFDNNLVDYTLLGETDLDSDSVGDQYNKVYEFDLSKVIMIPRRVYNNQGTSEITIQLFTYEANLTTDYGSKRLSVPYSISNESNYEYSDSTDGVYKLVMIDFKAHNNALKYNIGDIVSYLDGIYISLVNGNESLPSTNDWGAPTEAQILEFSYGGSANPPLTSVISDIMVSRYAKYNYILTTLLKTGFKEYDNKYAYELTSLLQSIREKALVNLLDHKPLQAAYELQQLKRASSTNNQQSKVRTYTINYTI